MAEGIHVEIILREKDDKAHKWHMRKIAELTIFNDVEMRVLEQTIDLSVQTIVRDRVKSSAVCPKSPNGKHVYGSDFRCMYCREIAPNAYL